MVQNHAAMRISTDACLFGAWIQLHVARRVLDVGTGKISVREFAEIISSRNRAKAGMNVAPEGLCLIKVTYRKGIFLKTG